MFKQFKYLELNRHHIIKKTRKILDENNTSDTGNFEYLCEVVFSSAMTLFLSFITETYFAKECSNILPIFGEGKIPLVIEPYFMFVCGIILYVVLFILVKFSYRRITKKIRNHLSQTKKYNIDVSNMKIKELIDDFDNITFDNLLIAYDYVEQIEQAIKAENFEIATFYFHETIYYLRTAITKTKEILIDNRREQCLNIKGNTLGVDVFRLFNAHRMMNEIFSKITGVFENNPKKICTYTDDLDYVISHQLKELSRDIKNIGNDCNLALKDLKNIE